MTGTELALAQRLSNLGLSPAVGDSAADVVASIEARKAAVRPQDAVFLAEMQREVAAAGDSWVAAEAARKAAGPSDQATDFGKANAASRKLNPSAGGFIDPTALHQQVAPAVAADDDSYLDQKVPGCNQTLRQLREMFAEEKVERAAGEIPLPEGRELLPARDLKIDGFASFPTMTQPNRGQTRAEGTGRGQFGINSNKLADDAPASIGEVYPFVRPLDDGTGFLLTVLLTHMGRSEPVTVRLEKEIVDRDRNELMPVTLGTLCSREVLNPNSFRSNITVKVSYAEVNDFLAKKTGRPGLLSCEPGNTLFDVIAYYHDRQTGEVVHTAGGPVRGGMFRCPAAENTTASAVKDATGAQATPAADIDLDMAVRYAPELLAVPELSQLKRAGAVSTRLQTEDTLTMDAATLERGQDRMWGLYEAGLRGDNQALAEILGPDWEIKALDRFWLKEGASTDQKGVPGQGHYAGYLVDPQTGRPLVEPINDAYLDNDFNDATDRGYCVRLRSNSQAVNFCVKPGNGHLLTDDGTTAKLGIEYDFEPGTTAEQAAETLRRLSQNDKFSATVYNQLFRSAKELNPELDLTSLCKPSLAIKQRRLKFNLRNKKTGLEIQCSFDLARAQAARNGREAVAAFFETNLQHKEITARKVMEHQTLGAQNGMLWGDARQDDWLAHLSDHVTMDVEPRLHEPADMRSKAFASSSAVQTYLDVKGKITRFLFDGQATPCDQKFVELSRTLGLIKSQRPVLPGVLAQNVRLAGRVAKDDQVKELVAAIKDDVAEPLTSAQAPKDVEVLWDVWAHNTLSEKQAKSDVIVITAEGGAYGDATLNLPMASSFAKVAIKGKVLFVGKTEDYGLHNEKGNAGYAGWITPIRFAVAGKPGDTVRLRYMRLQLNDLGRVTFAGLPNDSDRTGISGGGYVGREYALKIGQDSTCAIKAPDDLDKDYLAALQAAGFKY